MYPNQLRMSIKKNKFVLKTQCELRRGSSLNSSRFRKEYKKRAQKTSNEWRCRDRSCASTLYLCTIDGKVLCEPSTHTCRQPASAGKSLVDEAVDQMKQRVREETTPIPKIYTQEVVEVRTSPEPA